ncbi:MAG: MFS transporter [Candidatus Schekmanbacteria bacterium]|nr:MFS transporter [Candidatus Schekmanbacteria bacterium]
MPRLAILSLLYFAEGLPFGFQATAVPVLLRAHGTSLTAIGLAGMLAAPWLLKILWAPAVDGYGSASYGHRKSWIVPCLVALAALCVGASHLALERDLGPILFLVLAMNAVAATLDIAVDGLAVDILEPRELGLGNAAQVVGYKVGMLASGGLLMLWSGELGWSGMTRVMATVVLAAAGVAALYREPPRPANAALDAGAPARRVVRTLIRAVQAPDAGWLLLVVGTYKLGESIVDAMFKPFLLDAGLSVARIGLWLGTYGMVFSLLGSLAGGWIASRSSLFSALALTAMARLVPLAGEWWLASSFAPPVLDDARVLGIVCAEHFCGGALTTTMFAFMMSRVDRRIGATHFTLLACVEVLGKSPGSWLSGLLADRTGYAATFLTGLVLSAFFLALLPPLRRWPRGSSGESVSDGEGEEQRDPPPGDAPRPALLSRRQRLARCRQRFIRVLSIAANSHAARPSPEVRTRPGARGEAERAESQKRKPHVAELALKHVPAAAG